MKEKLLEMPFDQYQRYLVVKNCVEAYKGYTRKETVSILDVGGYPGLIKDFITADKVTVTDVIKDNMPDYIKADATSLPFKDNSFDVVSSTDVLEHIPEGKREKFINESLRVAKDLLIVVAPFNQTLNPVFEGILSEYVVSLTGAPHPFLKEHIENGLPDFQSVASLFKKRNLEYISFPNGYLYNWLIMMMIHAYLRGYSHYEELRKKIDKYYNENFSPTDNREPAYRTVLIVSKKNDRSLLETIHSIGANTSDPPDSEIAERVRLISMVGNLFRAEIDSKPVALLEQRIIDLKNEASEMKALIANQKKTIASQEKELADLRRWISEIQKKPSYKLYRYFRKILRRAGE